MIMFFTTGCAVKLPVPEVTEGRFDFSVTYEVNGEEKTYSGVYVCKYEGICVTFVRSSREWDGYIEGTNSDTFVAVQTTVDNVVIYIDFGFYPEYFMSDPDYIVQKPQATLFVECIDSETGEVTILGDEEEIFENYGIKLISYYYAEPIENSYKTQWSFGHFEPGIN